MKKIVVKLNLTDREMATIKWYGFKPKNYIQSIIHHDLAKIATAEAVDGIPEERIIQNGTQDANLL